jgi:hypothetical protein
MVTFFHGAASGGIPIFVGIGNNVKGLFLGRGVIHGAINRRYF